MSFLPMFGIIEGVSAFHLPQNTPNHPRLQFLNHPGVSMLRRNRIGGLEPLCSGRDKAILGVIARMAEDKNQADAPAFNWLSPPWISCPPIP
jgi:hypothetical protein